MIVKSGVHLLCVCFSRGVSYGLKVKLLSSTVTVSRPMKVE